MESQIRNTISLELRRQGVGPAGEEPLQRALTINIGDVTSSLRINGSGLSLGDRAVVGLCEALLKLIIAERGGGASASPSSSIDTAFSKPIPLLPREWYIDLSSNNLTDRCAPHIQLLISRGCTLPEHPHTSGTTTTTSTATPPLQNIDPNTHQQHHHHRLGTLSTRLRHLDVTGNAFSEGKGLKRLMGTRSKVLEELAPRTSAAGVPTILLCDADHADDTNADKTKPHKLGLGSLLARAEAVGGVGSSSATTSASGTAGGGVGRGSSILGDGSIASGPLHKPGVEPKSAVPVTTPTPPPVLPPSSPTSNNGDLSLPTVSLSMSSPVITVTPGSPVTPAADPRAQTQTPQSHRQETHTPKDETPKGQDSSVPAVVRPTFVDYDVAEVGGATVGDDSVFNAQQISFPQSMIGSDDVATHDDDGDDMASPASTAVPPSTTTFGGVPSIDGGIPPLAGITTAPSTSGRTTTVSLMGGRKFSTNNKDGLEESGFGGGMARTTTTNLIGSTSQSGAHPDMHANSRRRTTTSSEVVLPQQALSFSNSNSNTAPAPTTAPSAPSRPPAPITAQDYVDVCGGTAPTKLLLLDTKGAHNHSSSMVREDVPIVDGGAVLVLSDQLPQHHHNMGDMMARFQRIILAPVPVGPQMVNVTVLSIANNRLTHLPLLPPHLTRLDASYNHLSFTPHRFGGDGANTSTTTALPPPTTTMSTTLEEGSPEADAAISLAHTLSECPYLRIVNLRHNHLPGMGFTITSSNNNNTTASHHNTSTSRSVHNTSIGLSGPTSASSRHSQQYSSLFAGNKCLVHLFLGCNVITSVDGVGHCPLLETLDLGHNYIRSEAAIRALSLNSDSLKHLILEGNPLLSNPKLYTLKGANSRATTTTTTTTTATAPTYPTMAHMLEVSARKYQRNLRNLCPSLLVIDNVPLSFSSVADAKRREWDSVLGTNTNTSAHQSSTSTSVLHRSSCTVGGYSGSARATAAATAALKAQEAKMARTNSRQSNNSYARINNTSMQSGGGDMSISYSASGGGRMLQMSGGGCGGGSDGPFNPGVFVVTSDNGLVNSSTFVPPSNTAAPDRSAEAQKAVGASLRGGPNSSLYAGYTYRSKNQTYNTTHQDGASTAATGANLRTRSAALEALNTIAEAANQNATDRMGTHYNTHSNNSYANQFNIGPDADASANWSPPNQNARSGAPRGPSSSGADGMNSSGFQHASSSSSSSSTNSTNTSSSSSSSDDDSSSSDTSSSLPSSSSDRLISMSPEMQPPATYFPYDPVNDPPLKSSLRIRHSPSPTALAPLGTFRAGTPLDVVASESSSKQHQNVVDPLTPTDVTDAFLRAISRTRHSSTCPSTDGQQSSSFNARLQQVMVATDRTPVEHTPNPNPTPTSPPTAANSIVGGTAAKPSNASRLRSPASAQVRDTAAVGSNTAVNVIGSMTTPPEESSSSEEDNDSNSEERSPPPTHPMTKPQPLHLSQVLSIISGGHDDIVVTPTPQQQPSSAIVQSSPKMGSTSTVDAADVLDPESPIPTSTTKRGNGAKVVVPPMGIKAVGSNNSSRNQNGGALVRNTSSVGLGSADFGEEWDGEDDRVYHNNPPRRQASTASTATTVQSTGSGEELFLKTWREHVASGDGHSANSSPTSMPLHTIAERLLSNKEGGCEEDFSTTVVSKADKFAMSENSMGTALAGELKEIQGFMLESAASIDDTTNSNKHTKQPSKATTPRGQGDHVRVNNAMPPTATTTASTAIAASSDREYNPHDDSNMDVPLQHGSKKGRLSFFPEEVEEESTTTTTAATARHSSPREDMTREPSSVAARTAHSTGEFYVNSNVNAATGLPPRTSSITVGPLSPSSTDNDDDADGDDEEAATTATPNVNNVQHGRNIPAPDLSTPKLQHHEAGSCYDDAPDAIRQDAAARARDAAYMESIHRRVDELNSGAYGFGMVVPQPSSLSSHNNNHHSAHAHHRQPPPATVNPSSWTPQPLLTNTTSSPAPTVSDTTNSGGGVYPLLGGGQRSKPSNHMGRAPSATTAPQPVVNGQPLALASPAYYPEIAAASAGHASEYTPAPTRHRSIPPSSPHNPHQSAARNATNKPMTVATPQPIKQHQQQHPAVFSAAGRGGVRGRMPSPSPVAPPSLSPTTTRWSQELDSDVIATKAALRTLLSILQSQQATLLKYMKANPKEYPASGVKTGSHSSADGGSSEVLAAQYDPASLRAAHSALQGLASTLPSSAMDTTTSLRKGSRIVSSPPPEEESSSGAVVVAPSTPTDQRLSHHSMAPLSPMDDSYSSPRIAYGEPIVEHLHHISKKAEQRPTPTTQPPTTRGSDPPHHHEHDHLPLARAYKSWCEERAQCNTTITLAGLLLDTQIPESAAVELGLTVELLSQISSALSNDALEQLIATHQHTAAKNTAVVEEVKGKVVRNLRDASEGKTCLRYIGACLQAGREDLLVRYVAALQNVI